MEGTDEGERRLRLLWVALMVEADGAERATARGEPFDDDVARTLGAAGRARDQPGQWAEGRATPRWRPRS